MAEHKAEQSATGTTLFMERVKSVAAIIAALYFTLNTILSAFNVNPLPFTNEDVSAAVSSVGRGGDDDRGLVEAERHDQCRERRSQADHGDQDRAGGCGAGHGRARHRITPATSETSEAGEVGDDDSEVERDIVTGTPVIHMGA